MRYDKEKQMPKNNEAQKEKLVHVNNINLQRAHRNEIFLCLFPLSRLPSSLVIYFKIQYIFVYARERQTGYMETAKINSMAMW